MNRIWLLAILAALIAAAAFAQEPPPAAPPAANAPAGQSAAPGTPASGATAPAAPEGAGAAAAAGYYIRLRTLQERVDDLKSRVFDSKTKLLLLREQILQNLIAEARAVIVHVNEASSALTLEEALYFLDNEKIYFQSNRDGSLDSRREFAIYNGTIGPGNHILSVELVYRGNGKVFTYLSGYVFRIKSSFTFYAAKGQETRVRAVGFEKGGMTTRLEERPSVRFEMQQRKVSADSVSQPATP